MDIDSISSLMYPTVIEVPPPESEPAPEPPPPPEPERVVPPETEVDLYA